MADAASEIPAGPGLRWSQEACLACLGNPESFRWAQAVVLDHGGDDDQWMKTLRKGLAQGARVGALAVAGGAVAYGELLGATKGMLGGPKRNHPRWTWQARGDDITGVDYRPFVAGRFGPYSDITITTNRGAQRFGVDWSSDADSLVCAIREIAGAHRPMDGSRATKVQSDGVYVAARKSNDDWKILVADAGGNRFASFAGMPHVAWRMVNEDENINWLDITTREDGVLEFGSAPTELVPLADGAISTQPNWNANKFTSREYVEWTFVPADALLAQPAGPLPRLSPTPGRPVLDAGRLVIEGFAPYQTIDDLEAANAARGPIATLEYIQAALSDSAARSGGFFSVPFYLRFVRDSVIDETRPGERVDLAMPVVVETDAASTPVGEGAKRVKPRGKLVAGLIVTLDDRFVLAWTEGAVRMTPHSLTLPYAEIQAINLFEMRTKMSTLPAFEVLTPSRRIALTFTNHPDCNADFVWWRDRLTSRLKGWIPVYDGVKVIRWERPAAT